MVMKTGILKYGDLAAQELSQRYAGAAATRSAIKGIPAAARCDGMLVMSDDDGSMWRFDASAAQATDVAEELLLVPSAGSGRWVRRDSSFIARLPIAFDTADAALLLTMPENFVARIANFPYWEVTTAFTGGSSSAIGMSATRVATTKGDLLGGAAGDVLASLTAGIKLGTIGPLFDTLAEWKALLLVEGDSLRFDRITSAFTAGAGYINVPLSVQYTGPATP